MKTCSKCEVAKPLESFYRHRQSKDGRRPDCKACLDSRGKAYRSRSDVQEKARAYRKQYKLKMTDDQRQRYEVSLHKHLAKSPRQALAASRSNALRRFPTDNPISIQQLWDLWVQQGGKCALTGRAMTWRQGRITPTSISIDRIDNDVGYTASNVRLVCYSINAFRNTMTDDEMFTMALSLIANMKKPKLKLVS